MAMVPELQLDHLAVPVPGTKPIENKPNSHDGRSRFLRGPVPLPWLQRAAALPGKALHLGIVLWFLAGVTKRQSGMSLEPSRLREFAVSRHAAYRALGSLEAAQLVRVTRHRGRAARVDLIC